MATNTLTDTNISDTYPGLLHAKGEALPVTGQQIIYDGDGNVSDMKLGRSGQGVSFNGSLSAQSGNFVTLSCTNLNSNTIVGTSLTVNGLKYPTGPGSLSSFMVQGANNQMVMTTKIPSGSIPALIPSPAGTYSQINTIAVNSAGQVTAVTEVPAAGAYTVTSTTYLQFASNPTDIITPGENYGSHVYWSNVPTTAKAVILYAGPRNSQEATQGIYKLWVSPDGTGSHEYPVSYAGGGESGGHGPVPYMDGTQFVARCETYSSGVRVYFRRGSGSPSQTLEIYLIGYQQ